MGSSKEVVLVTGAAGFIGSHVVDQALAAGFKVRATDLPNADFSYMRTLDVEVVPGDLIDPVDVAKMVEGVDHIIMVAAVFDHSKPMEFLERINVGSRRVMCEAALASGPKTVVEFSSCDVYGSHERQPIDESFEPRPENDYSKTKVMAEREALRFHREHGLPVTVVRPTAVYGPRGIYTASLFVGLPCMIREMGLKKLPLPTGGFKNNLVHVEDIARSAIFLLNRPEALGRVFNVADKTHIALGDMLHMLLQAVGIKTPKLPFRLPRLPVKLAAKAGLMLPEAAFRPVNRFLQKRWDKLVKKHGLEPGFRPRWDKPFLSYGVSDHTYDISAIEGLGFELKHPDLKEGWAETIGWYVENNWIPAPRK